MIWIVFGWVVWKKEPDAWYAVIVVINIRFFTYRRPRRRLLHATPSLLTVDALQASTRPPSLTTLLNPPSPPLKRFSLWQFPRAGPLTRTEQPRFQPRYTLSNPPSFRPLPVIDVEGDDVWCLDIKENVLDRDVGHWIFATNKKKS